MELVTPTGAALVSALAERFGAIPQMRLEAAGAGAGARELKRAPNIVRVLLGESTDGVEPPLRPVSLIETNLDDLPPELVPDAAASATAAGALDVWTAPAGMKKGRPGVIVSALARPDREGAVASALLRSTTALGVRVSRLERYELDREWRSVEVAGWPVSVKLGRLGGEVVNVAPEHDDCARAAAGSGQPVAVGRASALAQAQGWVGEHDDGGPGEPALAPRTRRSTSSSGSRSSVAAHGSVVVAFSGGVDSSLVAAVAARALGSPRARGHRRLAGAGLGRARGRTERR